MGLGSNGQGTRSRPRERKRYHSTLELIETETGESLKEFRIPSRELFLSKTNYGMEMVILRDRFMLRIDAVLRYFRFLTQEPDKAKIGFSRS
jgi:hypothetical protein